MVRVAVLGLSLPLVYVTAQGRLIVGDRRCAAEREHTSGGVPTSRNAQLVRKTKYILAVDIVGRDVTVAPVRFALSNRSKQATIEHGSWIIFGIREKLPVVVTVGESFTDVTLISRVAAELLAMPSLTTKLMVRVAVLGFSLPLVYVTERSAI